MLLRSPTLSSTRHGFSLRQGGVSQGRYESLNLSFKWGDELAHVDENRRRFAEAGGFELQQLCTVRQVHGRAVAVVAAETPASAFTTVEADALVSEVPGVALAVGTADCVPILLADARGRVAAIHAGWRGTILDIVGQTVLVLRELGAHASGLRAALGPSICVSCFEVGEEVATQFRSLGCVDDSGERPHVDLRLANRTLLERAGVAPDAIDASPPCTMCDRERFFSFRRDGGQIGQHLSFVVAGART